MGRHKAVTDRKKWSEEFSIWSRVEHMQRNKQICSHVGPAAVAIV